jgi:hypothetical protein
MWSIWNAPSDRDYYDPYGRTSRTRRRNTAVTVVLDGIRHVKNGAGRTRQLQSRRPRKAPNRQPRYSIVSYHSLKRYSDMSAQSWRERREAYLREGSRWVDLIREGYVQHRLTAIDGGGGSGGCEWSQSPVLILISDRGSLVRRGNKTKTAESRPDALRL